MTVDVVAGGRWRAFEISRLDGGWRVAGGGRTQVASLAPAGGCWSLLVGDTRTGGAARSYEVAFDGDRVLVNGRLVSARVMRRVMRGPGAGPGGASAAGAPHLVSTPMPGRVVRVLVAPGDAVANRQALVVVEAMKMENEVRAPRAGKVAEVRVAEGMPVEARTVLVVLE